MRTLKLYRPKRTMACMSKVTVELDGKKIGKLANGKELSIPLDEQAHELQVRFWGGKKYASKLAIPAGSFSYALQTEMLETTFGTTPVLVPFGGPTDREPSRLVQLLVYTLTSALMDQNLRDIFTKLPDARLQLVMDAEKWELVVCAGSARKTVLVQPYSSRTGSAVAVTLNVLDHTMDGDLRKPEGRELFANMVFTKYLRHLPDYQVVGKHELTLVTSPDQRNAPQAVPAKIEGTGGRISP